MRRYIENKQSNRTITPNLDRSCDDLMRRKSSQRSVAIGSIAKLMDNIPEIKIKGKKIIPQESYEPEVPKRKRIHTSMDLDRLRSSGYAGTPTKISSQDGYTE
jgi:hypothetical protein